jgi:hypothetical protein
MTLHQQREHPSFVEDCYACRIGQVTFGSGTSFTKTGGAGGSMTMEKQLELDRPAYKAMKEQGIQPARLIGAHELMSKAETKFEIESGRLMPGKAKQVEAAVKEFKEFTGKNANESSAVRL